MQNIIDLAFMSGILAGLISIIGGIYIAHIWYKQKARLITDLPLIFGFSFILQGLNVIFLTSMNAGVVPNTLGIFKIRTFLIGGAVFPFLTIILLIWASKYQKYFKYVLSALVAYWMIVTIVGPTQTMIMILVLPVMSIVMFGMILTFAVTYKTGRLHEVRSGLILIAMAFMTFSQLTKAVFMSMGLSFISDTATVIGTVLITIAVANPWKPKSSEPQEPSQEIYA